MVERIPVVERFWARVDKTDSCWLWTGALYPNGYGVFRPGRHLHGYAHRYAYEHFVGPIPEGLHIDHLCRVRSCVNPAHLEPVTPAENLRRGSEFRLGKMLAEAAQAAAQLADEPRFCPQGHVKAGPNLILRKFPDGRVHYKCRACKLDSGRRRWQRITQERMTA